MEARGVRSQSEKPNGAAQDHKACAALLYRPHRRGLRGRLLRQDGLGHQRRQRPLHGRPDRGARDGRGDGEAVAPVPPRLPAQAQKDAFIGQNVTLSI